MDVFLQKARWVSWLSQLNNRSQYVCVKSPLRTVPAKFILSLRTAAATGRCRRCAEALHFYISSQAQQYSMQINPTFATLLIQSVSTSFKNLHEVKMFTRACICTGNNVVNIPTSGSG